jgi:hypothetical protein
MSQTPDEGQPDIVDEHFRPFVRALGNLVITFALAEAELLDFVSAMLGDDELLAVNVLKAQDAKEKVLTLANSIGLTGFDRDELSAGIESFWADKGLRNRLIHDQWYTNLFELGAVGTRGMTRTRNPAEVFGTPSVDGVWRLAATFQYYDGLFSHRAYMIRRTRTVSS